MEEFNVFAEFQKIFDVAAEPYRKQIEEVKRVLTEPEEKSDES